MVKHWLHGRLNCVIVKVKHKNKNIKKLLSGTLRASCQKEKQ